MTILGLPIRINGTKVDASWWNDIRTALVSAFGSITEETQFTVNNNEATPVAITGLIFDSADLSYARVELSVVRTDDTPTRLRSKVTLDLTHKPTDGWDIEYEFLRDNPGLVFSIHSTTGQVSYTSTNMAGANYVGKARFKVTTTFNQET